MTDASTQIAQKIETAEIIGEELLEKCPVKPLGHSSGSYYFVSPVGQQRALKYNEFSWNGIVSLFEGDLEWLETNFPRGESARKKPLRGFDIDNVIIFLIRACQRCGMYDDSLHIRRAGVWRDDSPKDGGLPRLVVHCGDTLFIEGEQLPAGQRIGPVLYESRSRVAHIGDRSSTIEDGKFLLETLSLWNFSRDVDVDLMAGWIGQGMLGAAPGWRVHMMVTAQAGAGKSWLANAIKGALGAAAHDIKNNFTEAGLRQSLSNEARVLMLDESEHEEGGGRVQKVIELLRHMSGGEGSRGVRGSSGGHSQSFSVTGCAYLSSILHVPLRPQDKSRITHLKLRTLANVSPEQIGEVERKVKKLVKLSPFYRRRMVDGWHRFMAAFELYRGAFLAEKLNSRAADQLATLYAGRDVLLFDEMPVSDSIAEDIERARPAINDLIEQATENNEGTLCLNHLYSSIADLWRSGERQTIGQLICDAVKKNSRDVNKQLGQVGLRYEPNETYPHEPGRLIVANQSVGLDRIFSGTVWSGGVWSQALSYLNCETSKACRFAGVVAKGLVIPHSHWPEVDE